MIKLGFWEEGENLGEDKDLGGGERLRAEVNNSEGWGVRFRSGLGEAG